MMKDNIILIGMPGSGKSTLGVLLAKTLGYQFIDTDLIISGQQRATLQEILDTRGLEAFLCCEEQAGLSVDAHRTVIATGGSMVLREKAMKHLRDIGTILFLDIPPQELSRRLKNIKTRGIAARPGETLAQIYEERLPLYRRYGDVTVSIPDGAHMEDAVAQVVEALHMRQRSAI